MSFLTDAHLDYSLVAVGEKPRGSGGELRQFGWNRLIEDQGKIVLGEHVNIIQHPGGEPKQLALRENQLVDLLDDFLHYETDTAPGSSGSPVFNDQWELVALHHSGVPRRDDQGRLLTRDGALWTEELGEHRIDWVANEGARISRIVRHVKEQALSTDSQRRLRSEMLEAAPATAPPDLRNSRTGRSHLSARRGLQPVVALRWRGRQCRLDAPPAGKRSTGPASRDVRDRPGRFALIACRRDRRRGERRGRAAGRRSRGAGGGEASRGPGGA